MTVTFAMLQTIELVYFFWGTISRVVCFLSSSSFMVAFACSREEET